MNEEKFITNYSQIITAIQSCIDLKLIMPTLILTYTTIDSISWLACNDPRKKVGDRFQDWTNEWMLSNSNLDCSAKEFYAARCGILHTLTPDSTLTDSQNIRKIAYAWGKACPVKLKKTISKLNCNNNLTSIHIEELFAAFKLGMVNYLEYVLKNKKEREQFLKKTGNYFTNVDMKSIDIFLKN